MVDSKALDRYVRAARPRYEAELRRWVAANPDVKQPPNESSKTAG